MDHALIDEFNDLSDTNTTTYWEKIDRLASIGIERYIVDLVGLRIFYFNKSGETYISDILLTISEVPEDLNSNELSSAITNIKHQKINYLTFLLSITKAGCCHYEVFITGKKIVYFGRKGEQYIDSFE